LVLPPSQYQNEVETNPPTCNATMFTCYVTMQLPLDFEVSGPSERKGNYKLL
jgi:hypothetical protein